MDFAQLFIPRNEHVFRKNKNNYTFVVIHSSSSHTNFGKFPKRLWSFFAKKREPFRLVFHVNWSARVYFFCCGMLRSGSTWQYMVASHFVENRLGGRRLGFMNGERKFLKYDRSFLKFKGWKTVKMHAPQQAFADALAAKRAIAVHSYRDVRDVIFSVLQKTGETFENYVEKGSGLHSLIEVDAFWRAQPNLLNQSYDDIVDHPVQCIEQIAQHLGLALQSGEGDSIAEQFSLKANKKLTEALEQNAREKRLGKFLDERTQLHFNHIHDAKTGKWRDLASREQLACMAQICGKWLIENGYERDMSWSQAATSN